MIRLLAEICLAAARGDNVEDRLLDCVKSASDVERFISLAQHNKVATLLAGPLSALRDQCGFDQAVAGLPDLPRSGVAAKQCVLLRAQLIELDRALENQPIQPVLLKGAVQLFEPVYPSAEYRSMADLDIFCSSPDILAVLAQLGYRKKYDGKVADSSDWAQLSFNGSHHIDPLVRTDRLAAIEVHRQPCMVYYDRLFSAAQLASTDSIKGCRKLRKPTSKDQLIISLIHSLLDPGERVDTYHLRGLVECELIYEQMSQEEKAQARSELFARGGASVWTSWRALSDWLFRDDARAWLRTPRSAWLITEIRLRAHSSGLATIITFFWKWISRVRPRFWSKRIYRMTWLYRLIRGNEGRA